MIAINDIKDGIKIKRNWWNCRKWWHENDQMNGIDGIDKTVGIGSSDEIGIESAVLICMVELRAWKLWKDGFNQIDWSDGTNGTECVRIDRDAGSVWFHWMKLSEGMKCKHIELIELTICMVGGTESGARIYNKNKICNISELN